MAGESDLSGLDLLARVCQKTLRETPATRMGVADRTLCLQTIEFARRIERRSGEQQQDLGFMVKEELGGALANMLRGSRLSLQ